jgi:hypothetical protein
LVAARTSWSVAETRTRLAGDERTRAVELVLVIVLALDLVVADAVAGLVAVRWAEAPPDSSYPPRSPCDRDRDRGRHRARPRGAAGAMHTASELAVTATVLIAYTAGKIARKSDPAGRLTAAEPRGYARMSRCARAQVAEAFSAEKRCSPRRRHTSARVARPSSPRR